MVPCCGRVSLWIEMLSSKGYDVLFYPIHISDHSRMMITVQVHCNPVPGHVGLRAEFPRGAEIRTQVYVPHRRPENPPKGV